MKTFVNSILITGILALFANTSIAAQTSNAGFEQWYRAKYGRPSPTEQASLNAPQASSTLPVAAEPTVAVTEFEHWYRAKYGRPSPTEQALLKAPQVQFVTPEAMPPMAMSEFEQSARTPVDHHRLAQSYRAEAQGYLAQAKEHEAMVAAYKANSNINAKNQAATIGHCEYFAAKYNGLAAQSQARAQMHEQMAKDAGL